MVTDEDQAAVFSKLDFYSFDGAMSLDVYYQHVKLDNRLSLRGVLAAALNWSLPSRYSYSGFAQPRPVLGALNNTTEWRTSLSSAINQPPSSFSDFDRYTLKRHGPDFLEFLKWKTSAQQESLSQLLQHGDVLGVHVNAFTAKEPLLKFALPLEKPAAETVKLFTQNSRGRQQDVDHFISAAAAVDAAAAAAAADAAAAVPDVAKPSGAFATSNAFTSSLVFKIHEVVQSGAQK